MNVWEERFGRGTTAVDDAADADAAPLPGRSAPFPLDIRFAATADVDALRALVAGGGARLAALLTCPECLIGSSSNATEFQPLLGGLSGQKEPTCSQPSMPCFFLYQLAPLQRRKRVWPIREASQGHKIRRLSRW